MEFKMGKDRDGGGRKRKKYLMTVGHTLSEDQTTQMEGVKKSSGGGCGVVEGRCASPAPGGWLASCGQSETRAILAQLMDH
jgi:hypothetical protein